jgi:cation diffusion facilitator CzcD-associated flavoprotein CzcO
VIREVVIIGAGFSGLGMGIRLKRAGVDDFVILEQGAEVGGTWRDNTYPGAGCDVQSHLYSFSFEPNPDWSRAFATQPEIQAYLVRCAEKYGLRPHLRFGVTVTGGRFDEDAGVWTLSTSAGELRARFVVSACGGLSRPAYPDLPGLDRFAGRTFHSARWDHAFPLAGKRVAVVGTGASAIQIVPAIAPEVGRLFVFQRTPAWILPKRDPPIPPWRRRLYRRVPALQRFVRAAIYVQRELTCVMFQRPALVAPAELLARRYLARSVRDPALREKLRPRYRLGCKRVLPTNDFYPALQRPNVELVTEGIREVTPAGIVTCEGREVALDAIVLATGFQAAEQVAPFGVYGRGGRDLDAAWADGAEAYLGTTVAGFPNLFLLVGPNTGLGHTSMVLMIEAQIRYAADAIRTIGARGWRWADVRPDAQARYNRRLHARLARTVWASGCDSWYRTRAGRNTTLWPGFTFEFMARTRRFDPGAYEVATGPATPPR